MQFLGYNISQTPFQEASGTATYAAERNADRVQVFIKRLSQTVAPGTGLSRLQNEYAITQLLDHPGIIRPIARLPDDAAFALVLEHPGAMSLETFQQGRWSTTDHRSSRAASSNYDAQTGLTVFFAVAMQLTKILAYLESQRVVHQAIHPGNIWIDPVTLQVTLTNFEQASRLPQEIDALPQLGNFVGRLGYISPEQTGRTRRGIDYRTDFYSLGVVFYQLLTGQLPFEATDPTAVLYAHLAETPRPPHRVKSTIPVMLSQLVMKLLAKDPEARYQSAKGLQQDVARCNWAWHGDREIPSFDLAQHDTHDRFTIAETLYGRDAEIDQLLMQFYQISHHPQKSLVLISGYSGVGKTAIVNQVQPQLARQRGYFIRGKFDQLQRHIPLSAVVYALRELIHQWLTQTDRQLRYWQEKLRAALGTEAAVMTELLPELAQIIGASPSVPPLTGAAAGNRFNLVLSRFVRVIAQPQHPLVIFLDDLQWADPASLALIQRWMLDPQLGHLLLIGAYRDHEVTAGHGLRQMQQQLQAEHVPLVELSIQPLPQGAITQMVADTLRQSIAQAAAIGAEIWRRTQGNPFFSRQLFTALYHDRLIVYQPLERIWKPDLERIGVLPIADDVVRFMVDRLQKLGPRARSLLSFAACIGHQFDLETLALMAGRSIADTGQALWPALQLGLLWPTDPSYRFYQPADALPSDGVDPAAVTYQFSHDRIQQAAYALIDPLDRPMTHLRLGRRLRDQLQLQLGRQSIVDTFAAAVSDADAVTDPTRWRDDRQILAVINQLNQGMALITDRAERMELAALNLAAGRRALAATAYQMACTGATIGITLLAATGWEQQYELNLALHELAAETAYLGGEFAHTAALVATIQQSARSLFDTIPACDIQIKAYIAAAQPQSAVAFGLQTLRQLGIRLPTHPRKWQAGLALAQTRMVLWQHAPTQLAQLPIMTDAWAIAVSRILQPITYTALLTQPNLMPFCALTSIRLALKFGNSVNLAYAYACYAMSLCSVFRDFRSGSQFAQLSLAITDVCDRPDAAPQLQIALAMFNDHWQMPVRAIVAAMPAVYQASLETGQLEMAAWALHTHSYNQYFAGWNLALLEQELAEYADQVRQFNQVAVLRFIESTQYAVCQLRGNPEKLATLGGGSYDIDQRIREAQAVQNWTEFFVLHAWRSMQYAASGDVAQAYADLQTAYPYLDALGSIASVPCFHGGFVLAAAAYYDIAPARQRRSIRQKIRSSLKYLKQAAAQCPANYASKYHLAQAEWQRIQGQWPAAIAAYDRAITLAQDYDLTSELALANDLTGRFFEQRQQWAIAKVYLIQAYHAYVAWGALAKVSQLLQRYPELLTQFEPPHLMPLPPSPPPASIEALSLDRSMQAARAIAAAVELTPLLENLMRIVLEESGADRGVLLLAQFDRRQLDRPKPDRRQTDQWQIYIDTTDTQQPIVLDPPLGLPSAIPQRLPNALVQYVSHTQEPLILNASDLDAMNPLLDQTLLPLLIIQHEPYVQTHAPQSMLGLPIVRQQRLVGILYLEHRQIEGVFSHDRVELLQMLCAQAAIAITNAQLYQRNQDYMHELEQTQTQLLELQANLMDQTLHDPLTGLYNRSWFVNRITWLLQYNRVNPPRWYAVLLLDLDRFKVINDSLGHLVGDQLLQAVVARLQTCVIAPDQISRLGGDEFVVMLESAAAIDDVMAVADSLLAQFTLPFTIGNYEIYSNVSIGITTSNTAYYNPEDVLRDADIALYAAKARNKGGYTIFDPDLQRSAQERLHLENDLRQAIADSQADPVMAPLYLDYQPIYDLHQRTIVGAEALVRWLHPIDGAISPVKFIPIAEETGLINTLGPWILATACAQLADWQQQGKLPAGFALHVNFSALQFHQVGWLESIESILHQTQIQPQQLKLEITENCLLNLVDVQPGAIAALQALGIRLCIDDFGVGYSSLSRLLSLPISTIKLDRSFVENCLANADQQAMIRMILTLAQTLNMEVVAEGVQTPGEIAYLQQYGCNLGQSFFLSHPIAGDRVAELF
jgi:diguanylate cyclase (GGDEF)-like protein